MFLDFFLKIITWRWLDDVLLLGAMVALTTAGYLIDVKTGTCVLAFCLAYSARKIGRFQSSDVYEIAIEEMEARRKLRKEGKHE